MIYNNVGYCGCGQEIWVEYLWNGKKWSYLYFDSDNKETTHCPNCKLEIKEDDLESM